MTWGKIGEDQWISMTYVELDEKPTVPETTVPETTVPEVTEPEPTVPETTVPEVTVPETTEPEETKPTQKTMTGTVKVNTQLKFRKGPGTNYGIAKYLKNGAKVTIMELKTVGSATWAKIGEGQWVNTQYIVIDGQKEETAAKTVTADCLNVRETPSTSAKIVGYYYEGDKVEVLETKKVDGITWGKTSIGWVSMDYLK